MSFPLDVEELERFCDGASYLGYYAIEDGQLFVEIYGPEGTTSYGGGYEKSFFEFGGESIISKGNTFNGRNVRDHSKVGMEFRRYDKYPIKGLKAKPFW